MPSQIVVGREAGCLGRAPPHLRRVALSAIAMPARQAAAAQRAPRTAGRRAPGGDLEARRCPARPPRPDGRRGDQRPALVGGRRARRLAAASIGALHQPHLAAVLANRRDLRQRRAFRHAPASASPPARGRRRRRACAWLPALAATTPARSVRRHPRSRQGAAHLERAGELEVLGLEQHASAHPRATARRPEHRRLAHAARPERAAASATSCAVTTLPATAIDL